MVTCPACGGRPGGTLNVGHRDHRLEAGATKQAGAAGIELCGQCRGEGLVAATAADLPDAETDLCLTVYHRAETGVWPVAGGWLDQSEYTLRAQRAVAAAVGRERERMQQARNSRG